MNSRFLALALATTPVVCCPAAFAAEDAVGKDLKATIVLQGHACDQIAATQRNGDSDYTASCKDGNRYHVYVNAQGRVVVDKL